MEGKDIKDLITFRGICPDCHVDESKTKHETRRQQ
jgi:hypothetical protein